MPKDAGPARTDPLAVVEVLLVLLLIALSVALYIIPAATLPFLPGWWTWIVLATLFFAVVVVDTYRRKGKARAELRDVLDRQEREMRGGEGRGAGGTG